MLGIVQRDGKLFAEAWEGGASIGEIEVLEVPSRVAANVYLRRDVAEDYVRMRDAAELDGVLLDATSGLRPHEKQQQLWDAAVAAGAERKEAGLEYRTNGRAPAPHHKTPLWPVVAYPGTSNHEAGTAVDFWLFLKIDKILAGKETEPMKKVLGWLRAHAHEYGFKENAVERWHWSRTGR